MKLHVHLTHEDYVQFNIFHALHAKTYKRNRLLGRFRYFILSPLLLLTMHLCGTRKELLIPLTVYALIYSTIWVFLYPIFVKRTIRKNISKLAKEGKLPYSEDSDLEFRDDSITETTSDSTNTSQYTDILSIHETTDAVYIMIGALTTIILPLRDLGNQKDALLALLREKCPHIAQ